MWSSSTRPADPPRGHDPRDVGPQAVVVGDEKQLPPTAFFLASAAEDDGPMKRTTQLAAVRRLRIDPRGTRDGLLPPPRTLAWHYRSRDERLIAFSNAADFYHWQLTTFPGSRSGAYRTSWFRTSPGSGQEEQLPTRSSRSSIS